MYKYLFARCTPQVVACQRAPKLSSPRKISSQASCKAYLCVRVSANSGDPPTIRKLAVIYNSAPKGNSLSCQQ